MPTLDKVLEQKDTILMAAKAWELSPIMLKRGEQYRLNLVAQKIDNAEENGEEEIGLLENYLSHTLNCEVSVEISYHTSPRDKLPLDADFKELTEFYGFSPKQISLKYPDKGIQQQMSYEAACEKVAAYRSRIMGNEKRFGY